MSTHIQNVEQARSFIESYYSAETSKAYVRRSGTTYDVSQNKSSLKTKDIARLTSEALGHISKPKDLLHLYDAIEKHVDKLEPAVVKFLKNIHFPFINHIKTCILHFPFTTSSSLITTMRKIDKMITVGWLQNMVHSEQDIEDFGLLEKWMKNHPHYDRICLENVVANCNKTVAKIQKASTLLDFLQIARIDDALGYDLAGAGRVRELLADILKKKIEVSSSQIASFQAKDLSTIACSIEHLRKDFEDITLNLREQLKKRITSKTTLKELVEIYRDITKTLPSSNVYDTFFKEKVESLISSQIECAHALKELEKIRKSLISIPHDFEGLKDMFQKSIDEKIKEIIFLQIKHANTLEKLKKIKESLTLNDFKDIFQKSIDEKIKEIISSQKSIQDLSQMKQNLSYSLEVEVIQPLIEKKAKELLSSQLEGIDSLEKWLKLTTESLVPMELYFSKIIKELNVVEKLRTFCYSELEKAETVDKLHEIKNALTSFFHIQNFHTYKQGFSCVISYKKNSIYREKIYQAKTEEQLLSLKNKISSDEDLQRHVIDLQSIIAQRITELSNQKKPRNEAINLVEKYFNDINDQDRALLTKLPPTDLLREFAENIPTALKNENLALALALSDFSDKSSTKLKINSLQLRVHPDKHQEEAYKQVANKLWHVLTEIINYIKTEELI